jgi:hypothetical protein
VPLSDGLGMIVTIDAFAFFIKVSGHKRECAQSTTTEVVL